MSGLFTELAARAHGEAHAVRPRLPARFETPAQDHVVELAVEAPAQAAAEGGIAAGPLESTFETTAERPAAPASSEPDEPQTEPPAQAQPAAARAPAAGPVPGVLHAEVERAAPADVTRPAPVADPRDQPAPAPPLAPKISPRPPEAVAPPLERLAESVAVPTRPAPPLAEARGPLAPRLTPARAEAAAPPQLATAPEETTVHVSIGRIELRATQAPPTPSAKPREAGKPAVMSLEDYLLSRRGRR